MVIWKLFEYPLDGIVAFSSTPLIFPRSGAGMCGVAMLSILFIIVRQFFGGSASGWPSWRVL